MKIDLESLSEEELIQLGKEAQQYLDNNYSNLRKRFENLILYNTTHPKLNNQNNELKK